MWENGENFPTGSDPRHLRFLGRILPKTGWDTGGPWPNLPETTRTERRLARPPRYTPPGVPQHVIQRGNNRAAMFARLSDFHAYRKHLLLACEEHGCRIHAYVFMSNHVHLIISPDSGDGLGLAIQSLGRRYVPYFNRSSGRTGALWERRYWAATVDTDRYLLACYR